MNNGCEKKCCGGGAAYVVAVVGAFLIVGGLVGIMRHYTRAEALGAKRADERRQALKELRAANADVLNNYAWQDQPKGIVRLPIDEAMRLAETLWHADPAAARSNLIARVEKANAVPPKAPEKPSAFE